MAAMFVYSLGILSLSSNDKNFESPEPRQARQQAEPATVITANLSYLLNT